MNIINKNILIERSVRFEETLQDMKLVEEETDEIPSRSTDDSDDENASVISDISDMISDIIENDISGSVSDPNFPLISQNGPKRLSLLSG